MFRGLVGILVVTLIMKFLYHGDPDLWDKLYKIAHNWANVTMHKGI